MILQNKKMTS